MDTTPTPRSHRDRRITPRRAEDVALHYATVNLIAAAVALLADDADRSDDRTDVLFGALVWAVEQYRRADAAAHGDQPPKQRPEIRWEHEKFGSGERVRAVHDGPCVFVDGQCSCGILDLGIVRADPPS